MVADAPAYKAAGYRLCRCPRYLPYRPYSPASSDKRLGDTLEMLVEAIFSMDTRFPDSALAERMRSLAIQALNGMQFQRKFGPGTDELGFLADTRALPSDCRASIAICEFLRAADVQPFHPKQRARHRPAVARFADDVSSRGTRTLS